MGGARGGSLLYAEMMVYNIAWKLYQDGRKWCPFDGNNPLVEFQDAQLAQSEGQRRPVLLAPHPRT